MIESPLALPHSVESERAVLGAVLLDPEALADVRAILAPEDLYLERHQALYRAMLDLQEEETGVDLRTLQAKLDLQGQLDLVGGPAYLASLDLDLPDVSRVGAYADIVRERSVRRRAIQAASESIRDLMNGGGLGAIAALQGQLEALAGADVGRGGFRPAQEIADDLLLRIEEGGARCAANGPRVGIQELDMLYGGIERGSLALIAGRSGVGKSAMLVQMLDGDLAAGRKVAVLSLEMPGRELLCRLWGRRLGVNWKRVWRGGPLSTEQWTRLHNERRAYAAGRQLFIDDTCAGLGLEALLARVRPLVRREGVTVVYLDFFTLVPRAGRRAGHEERDEQAYRIANFAKTKDQEVSFVMLAQCNRGPAKENRWPAVADVRDAGEQPAKYVFLLHRDIAEVSEGPQAPVYGAQGAVILGKARGDEEGAVLTHYDGRSQRWWSRREWEERQRQAPTEDDQPVSDQQPLFEERSNATV